MNEEYWKLQKELEKCDNCSLLNVCYSHSGTVFHLHIVELVCKNKSVKNSMKKLRTFDLSEVQQ